MPNKSCDNIYLGIKRVKLKKYITLLLHRTCLYGMKKFNHHIGCQYKPLLELKYKQIIGKRKTNNNTLLAYHNTEFEALFNLFCYYHPSRLANTSIHFRTHFVTIILHYYNIHQLSTRHSQE